MTLIVRVLFSGILFCSLTCETAPQRVGMDEYREIWKIPRTAEIERERKFDSFSPETQIDVYIVAMCCVEPSDGEVGRYLLNNGPDVISHITRRIQSETLEGNKKILIRLLVDANHDCNGCVTKDLEVMKTLRNSISPDDTNDNDVIRSEKNTYKRWLQEIEDYTPR